MKTLKWIIILFIPLNLVVILGSFAFPGKLKWADNYQVWVQKRIIHQLDQPRPIKKNLRKRSVDCTSHAIQYEELIPCLDTIQPGTLFFSVHGRSVSKIFISGEWKHCGIYLGTLPQMERHWGKEHALVTFLRPFYTSEGAYLVFDSSYDLGVSIHSIREMADLGERSTLRRLMFLEFAGDKDAWGQALLRNTSHLGKDYDYCFVPDNDDALYCSEFMVEVLPLEQDYFQPSRKIVGRALLVPSDLVEAILDKGIQSGTFRYKATISKK